MVGCDDVVPKLTPFLLADPHWRLLPFDVSRVAPVSNYALHDAPHKCLYAEALVIKRISEGCP